MQAMKQWGAALGAIILFFCVSSVTAQVTWLQTYDNHGGMLEFRKASGEFFNEYVSSYSVIANGHVRISPRLMGIVQLPLAHANLQDKYTFYFENFSGTRFGNPYLGIEFAEQNRSSFVLLGGIRLPISSINSLADEQAIYRGLLINAEQFEAFYPKMFVVQAAGGFQAVKRFADQNSFVWKTVVGGSYMSAEGIDAKFLADLNMQWWLYTQYVRIGAGGIARMEVTGDYNHFGERFSVQSGLSIMGVFGVVRPQVGLHIPVTNDLQSIMDLTYSFALGFDFGGNEMTQSDSF